MLRDKNTFAWAERSGYVAKAVLELSQCHYFCRGRFHVKQMSQMSNNFGLKTSIFVRLYCQCHLRYHVLSFILGAFIIFFGFCLVAASGI